MENMVAIVLAAGKGTRMKSKLPKVLHPIAGKPMINYIVSAVKTIGLTDLLLVVGHEADEIKKALGSEMRYILQEKQLGTGHAVLQTKDQFVQNHVLVLCGDTPMLKAETLTRLAEMHVSEENDVTILTADHPDPTGYGRIIRTDHGYIQGIVEEKDADCRQRKITEINTGIYVFKRKELFQALEAIRPNNAQGELYLTDTIEILAGKGSRIGSVKSDDFHETEGINNREQLAQIEKKMQSALRSKWMLEGVTLLDPDTVYIDYDVTIGSDTVIYPNTILQGKTTIGSDAKIGPGTRISNSRIGDGTKIEQAVVLDSSIAHNCSVGPFAYIRPETVMKDKSKVGTFVEIKKSVIETSSKVPHLTYVGDGLIGKNVNIGAGAIFVNYDGQNKHQTIVEDGAFVGCNTNLIAPVTVKENAYVAAGSTITKEVSANSLGIARARQENIEGWVLRKRKK